MDRSLAFNTLAGYLEDSARKFPDRVAVVDPSGASLTYRQLDDQAARVAAFLLAHGVAPGDRVGLVLPKSAIGVSIIFGVLKARAAYVPADWTAPAARICTILGDCQVRVAFIDARLNAPLAEGLSGIKPNAVVAVGTPDWDAVLSHAPAVVDASLRKDDDLTYILYTSGSTGIPKGVILNQHNATSYVDWCTDVFQPGENDRFSSHAPFHFDLSILDIYVPLKHGAALYLIGEDLGKSPRDLARFISANRLSVWYSTPSILTLLAEFGHLAQFDFEALRLVFFAGEVFPIKHLRKIVSLWPKPTYYNLYGPTETNVCTYYKVPTPIPEDRVEPFPIGWACSHCQPLVVDEVLYIAGPSVFQGYWNRPKETAAVFIERDGVRWYSTGDVIREDPADGFIYVGRRDRMVKRRGYRIELDDIENGLYRNDRLREVAVVAATEGEAGVKIGAYLAPHDASNRPTIVEMKAFCSKNLPSYMNPDVFHFVEALPRTSTNKVDYQSLLRSFRGG